MGSVSANHITGVLVSKEKYTFVDGRLISSIVDDTLREAVSFSKGPNGNMRKWECRGCGYDGTDPCETVGVEAPILCPYGYEKGDGVLWVEKTFP